MHVCIGSVYAWSTFNRPIQALFPDAPWWMTPPYPTFTTALVLLGLSAAFGGPWVERRGRRVAATAAAIFFGTGLLIGGVGLMLRQLVLVFLGMGIQGNQGRMEAEGPFYPDHGLDRIVAYHDRQDRRFAATAAALSKSLGKPILTATELAVADPDNAGPAAVRASGRLCYASGNRAVTALGHLYEYAQFRRTRGS